MNARYYEPTTGRFLSQDTYTGNPYEPWTQHLYSYCGNNPTNFIDPTGHMSEKTSELWDQRDSLLKQLTGVYNRIGKVKKVLDSYGKQLQMSLGEIQRTMIQDKLIDVQYEIGSLYKKADRINSKISKVERELRALIRKDVTAKRVEEGELTGTISTNFTATLGLIKGSTTSWTIAADWTGNIRILKATGDYFGVPTCSFIVGIAASESPYTSKHIGYTKDIGGSIATGFYNLIIGGAYQLIGDEKYRAITTYGGLDFSPIPITGYKTDTTAKSIVDFNIYDTFISDVLDFFAPYDVLDIDRDSY